MNMFCFRGCFSDFKITQTDSIKDSIADSACEKECEETSGCGESITEMLKYAQ